MTSPGLLRLFAHLDVKLVLQLQPPKSQSDINN